MPSSPPKPVAPAPAPAAPAISDAEKRAAEARAKMEEINRKRSEDAQKKAAYQEWIKQHDAPPGDDGIQVSDMGVMRTSEWVRTLDDGPDPPRGRDSTVNHWFPDHLKPDLGNLAARQSAAGASPSKVAPKLSRDAGIPANTIRLFRRRSWA